MNQLFSTYKDVIDLVPQLYQETEDTADSIALNTVLPMMNTRRIENYIKSNDGRILAELNQVYGKDLTITPYYDVPEGNYNNTSTAELLYTGSGGATMTLGASTLTGTDVYKVLFTDTAGSFSVSSQLYGTLGTATINTTFTASNASLEFDSTFWNGTPDINDRFYIKTYNVDKQIVDISASFAASKILLSVYTEAIPNQEGTSRTYNRQARQSLANLRNMVNYLPNTPVIDVNLDPIQTDYEIDDYGNDVTDYKKDEWNRRKQTDNIS